MDYPALRREKLTHALIEEGLDALLISAPVNVTYLTGFTGESSFLILARHRPLLVSDARYTEQLAEECPGLETHIRPPGQNLYQAVSQAVGELGVQNLGFESNHLTVAELEALIGLTKATSWKAGRDRVESLRLIKDPSEISQIRDAIAMAERAFLAFRSLLRATDTEKQLSDEMEHMVRRCGARSGSFPTIVAVDARAALPHAPPTDRPVRGAEVILVDWGAAGRLYKSDLTRVLLPTSSRSDRREEIYEIVLRAQKAAIQAIRPGVTGHEVDAAARAVIAAAGYGAAFGHSLGHGLGLQVHEGPGLRPNSEIVLQAGMVATVEPGIYVPGWGGVRIEDDVLVTSDGCEILSHLPRDLAAMGVSL